MTLAIPLRRAAALTFAKLSLGAAGAGVLAAALPAPLPAQTPAGTSARYSSDGLRELVARLANLNARIPDSLRAYRALVESEMAAGYRDTLGRDQMTQIEQMASTVRWDRLRGYDQRVVGYRSQTMGAGFSMLSFLGGWTVPHLYGNRLRIGIIGDSASQARGGSERGRRGRAAARQAVYVHPLAVDRDSIYEFSGGDTVATLRPRGRQIRIGRIHVRPRRDVPRDIEAFEGDLDFDTERMQLVRMRGKLVRVSPGRSYGGASGRTFGVTAVAFVEFENAEIEGRFWLPSYQRTEFQGALALLGDTRSVFRLVSRFRGVEPEVGTTDLGELLAADPAVQRQHRLTYAPSDSMRQFDRWTQPVGAATADVRSDDFADLAPEQWNPAGPTRVELRARHLGELVRFNRVEGLFTGLAVTTRFRDEAPGTELRAHGGWAWAEGTARGAVGGQRRLGGWTVGARAERALEHTGDFRTAEAGSSTLGAAISTIDDFDYVDRWSAMLFAGRSSGVARTVVARLRTGAFDDRAVHTHQSRGLFRGDSGFRPIRGITEGAGWRSIATFEYHPEVSGLFLQPGVGARLQYDRADPFAGGPRWGRIDGAAAVRRPAGPLLLVLRANAGLHLGGVAPQSLFELGEMEGLSGYDYKQFVGDRAAVGRALTIYTLPILSSPIRVRRFVFPSISPGLSAGVAGGWAELSSDAARRAADALVTGTGMLRPTPTGRVRATVDFRLTFLRGAASVGVARAIDRSAPWRLVWTLGQAL